MSVAAHFAWLLLSLWPLGWTAAWTAAWTGSIAHGLGAAAAPGDVPLQHAWTVSLEDWAPSRLPAPPSSQRPPGTLIAVHSAGPLLLVVDTSARLTALSAADGSLAWSLPLDGSLAFPPSYASESETVTLCTLHSITVLSALTGAVRGRHPLSSPPLVAPIASRDLLFVPSSLENMLLAVSLHDGRLLWRYRSPSAFRGETQLLETDRGSTLYLMGADGVLRAIPATTSPPENLRWSRDVGQPVGPLALQGDNLLISNSRNELLAVDSATGSLRWKLPLGSRARGSPVVAGEVVVVASKRGVRGVRATDGHVLWSSVGPELPMGGLHGFVLSRRPSGRLLGRSSWTGESFELPLKQRVMCAAGLVVDWSSRRRVSTARPSLPPGPAPRPALRPDQR